MVDNILRIAFKDKTSIESKPLYQYDYGQKIKFIDLDLPYSYEVHFSNRLKGISITQLGNYDGVAIPDQFLQTGLPVYAWVYLHTGQNDGETEYMVTIPVIQRAAPSNEIPTPQQESAIGQVMQALDDAVATVSVSYADITSMASDVAIHRSRTQYYMDLTEGYVNSLNMAVADGSCLIIDAETMQTVVSAKDDAIAAASSAEVSRNLIIDKTEELSEQLTWRLGEPIEVVPPTEVAFTYDSSINLYKYIGDISGWDWTLEENEKYYQNNVYAITFDNVRTILNLWFMYKVVNNYQYRGNIILGNPKILGEGWRDPYNVNVPYLFINFGGTKGFYTSEEGISHTIKIERIPVIFGTIFKPLETVVSTGTGDYSVVIGEAKDAKLGGIAIGGGAEAGNWATSIGAFTEASGNFSLAMGYFTKANGVLSFAQGYETVANSDCQIALGKFNIADSSDTYALIIGNGKSHNQRNNLFTVAWDGTVTASDKVLATEEYVNTHSYETITIGNTTLNETQLQKLLALIED